METTHEVIETTKDPRLEGCETLFSMKCRSYKQATQITQEMSVGSRSWWSIYDLDGECIAEFVNGKQV